MTNREKFNQCLLNYVNSIINMEDEELIKNCVHLHYDKWYGQYLKDFAHIYGYIPTFCFENFAQWLTQECIENVEI